MSKRIPQNATELLFEMTSVVPSMNKLAEEEVKSKKEVDPEVSDKADFKDPNQLNAKGTRPADGNAAPKVEGSTASTAADAGVPAVKEVKEKKEENAEGTTSKEASDSKTALFNAISALTAALSKTASEEKDEKEEKKEDKKDEGKKKEEAAKPSLFEKLKAKFHGGEEKTAEATMTARDARLGSAILDGLDAIAGVASKEAEAQPTEEQMIQKWAVAQLIADATDLQKIAEERPQIGQLVAMAGGPVEFLQKLAEVNPDAVLPDELMEGGEGAAPEAAPEAPEAGAEGEVDPALLQAAQVLEAAGFDESNIGDLQEAVQMMIDNGYHPEEIIEALMAKAQENAGQAPEAPSAEEVEQLPKEAQAEYAEFCNRQNFIKDVFTAVVGR